MILRSFPFIVIMLPCSQTSAVTLVCTVLPYGSCKEPESSLFASLGFTFWNRPVSYFEMFKGRVLDGHRERHPPFIDYLFSNSV